MGRAVSPVVGVVALVALIVVLAATVGGLLFTATDDLGESAPFVARSTGEFVPQGGNGTGGIVRLAHEGGDAFRVADVEIVVDAQSACGKTGRLVDLPAQGGDLSPTERYVEGDDVFDNSPNAVNGPIGTDGRAVDGVWEPNEVASFRVASRDCRITDGESITVTVVHRPSNGVLFRERLVAG